MEKKKLYITNNTIWFLKHHCKEFKLRNWIRLPWMYYKHIKGMRGSNLKQTNN